MQPVTIILFFQLFIKACSAEGFVDAFESGDDAREQFLECEGRKMGWEERVEGGGRCGIGCV